jgi:putative phage-type endonuclease
MELLNTEQNTDNWLEGRRKVIGGSDVHIILGVSPWKTRYQLFQEKMGKPQAKGNDYILKRGHVLEDRSRVLYELTYDIDVPPKVVKHPDFEFAQVSLDGLNVDHKKIVEFKFVGEESFNKTRNEDFVPDHYYPQIQYQMFCTGYDNIDYVAYSQKQDKLALVNVKADLSYIAKMIAHCEDFWWSMQNKIAPPLEDRDYKQIRQAKIRRTIESLKKTIKEEYKNVSLFKWDGVYMEIKDEEK